MGRSPTSSWTISTSRAAARLQTNVVAAEILDGVGISWPTLAGTNYTVQWTANLATNAVWNNLAAPIVGDGTTNCLFDPLAASSLKFYRILQSP